MELNLKDHYDTDCIPRASWVDFLIKAHSLAGRLETELEELFGETFCKFGFDPYDGSIEIYFSPETPSDWRPSEAQWEALKGVGASYGWLNFTDCTEIMFSTGHSPQMGPRKSKESAYWNEENYLKWYNGA